MHSILHAQSSKCLRARPTAAPTRHVAICSASSRSVCAKRSLGATSHVSLQQLSSCRLSTAAVPGRSAVRSRRSAAVVAAASGAKPWAAKTARLVLEDGSVWHGVPFGDTSAQVGEVVFNTSLTGYQEIMTDPSYKGQFVVFTCPHIGNVGVNLDDTESTTCHLGAIIVRDLSITVSNYRSTSTLDDYCKQQGVFGISGVDTRALTKALRDTGCLVGVITADASKTDEELAEQAKSWTIVGKDLLSVVSCTEPYEWKDPTLSEWEFNEHAKSTKDQYHVVAYDFGIKHNILRRLAAFGCRITVVPATYPAAEVMKLNPDGVFFSNGPGDPSAAPYAVDNARAILGQKPVFGICMGHQLLGQAFGGTTFKLKFGHHGGNHPIRHVPTGRVEISAQNHNFAVDPATLPAGVTISHINLNDGTCAGMVYADKKAMTIQYHPEASPGPHDADVCFEQFVDMMKAERLAPAVAGAAA